VSIINNCYLSCIISGSSIGSTFEQWELESSHRPRFGRNWWFWCPSISNNGGNFSKGKCTDIGIYWLCFCISLTLFL